MPSAGTIARDILVVLSCRADRPARGRAAPLVSGSYVETAGGLNPGATGTFIWQISWAESSANPIRSRSITAGSNSTVLHRIPSGAFFELLLGNGLYANLDFGPPDRPNPTGGHLDWQTFAASSALCTGVATRSVAEVVLTAGMALSTPVAPSDVQLGYPGVVPPLTPVPEPGTPALMAAGLAVTGAWGRGVGGTRSRVA